MCPPKTNQNEQQFSVFDRKTCLLTILPFLAAFLDYLYICIYRHLQLTTNAISCEFESRTLDTSLYDIMCHRLAASWWCSPISSTNKAERHDITTRLHSPRLSSISAIFINYIVYMDQQLWCYDDVHFSILTSRTKRSLILFVQINNISSIRN